MSRGGGLGGEQVEGRQAVRELLLAGRRRTREVWVAEGQPPSAALADIEELAAGRGAPVRRVTRGALENRARSAAPQGVLALAEALRPTDLDELAIRPSASGQPPFLLCLDGVTDPHNLGALLRSAECAGATGAVLPRHRSAHITPTVAKAAAGAAEHLALAEVAGLPAALSRLADRGVWVVGLDAGATESLFDLEVAGEPVALVVGAEGSGLRRLTRARCDVVVSIPMHGTLGALNVAAAGALGCYEVARRRRGG